MKNKYYKTNERYEACATRSEVRLKRLSGPADEMDAICRRRLPDGVIRNGVLAGREAEIRQEALILCLSGYLEGRPDYVAAKVTDDSLTMETEMERCAASALKISKLRLESKLKKEALRSVSLDEGNGGSCLHPSEWNIADLPQSKRVSVVLRAADEAVRQKKLSAMNVAFLTMVVRDGMSVCEISEKVKVSSGAVYQQLRRVRKVLPEWVDKLEV